MTKKKLEVVARDGADEVTYDDMIEAAKEENFDQEKVEPRVKRPGDPISKMVGADFRVEGRYENWYKDQFGNRIRFDLFYPAKKLYIDMFEEETDPEVIAARRKLVEDNGGKYLPVNAGESIIKQGNKMVAFVFQNNEQQIMAEVEL